MRHDLLTRLPRSPHCALSATVNVALRPMTVSLTLSIPHVSNDPCPDDVPTAEPTNCLPHGGSLEKPCSIPKNMHSQNFHCRTSHGVVFRFTATQRIRCLSPRPACHTTSRQQHHHLLSPTCVPQGQPSLQLPWRRAPDVPSGRAPPSCHESSTEIE